MWLTALQYFHQAATLGSMRLASDKLGVAVSSISRQVAQLEQELGLPLIERGRRSIKLTAAGELALEYYRDQLSDREALLSRLRDLKQNRIGLVQLAVGEGLLGGAFASFVEKYQRANPGIALSLVSGNTADITRLVLEDEAHMGLILHVSSDPKIRNRLSVAQPLMVMCAPTHRVAALHSLTLSQLREHALCLPPRGFSIRRMLNDAEQREHVWLEPRLTTSSLFTMREIAKLGTMVTVLPRISAISELQEGTLVSRPLLAEELEHCTVTLIHRVGRRLDGAPLRVLGLLESQLKSWSEEIR
jgi:DNA-binding transcriptional LysR family regulator